ncbi:hypothetical protein [Paenibacillus typhae]|uniref:hypothetical protein n=1 Tax=Paenibacillus typhae TaxID=1174501 RepID=UPI001C8EE292|nr:hypothetical protein [Paenibacillus typhae]MBY0009761.1 hypothetical protein [Paenibacillus typhae]
MSLEADRYTFRCMAEWTEQAANEQPILIIRDKRESCVLELLVQQIIHSGKRLKQRVIDKDLTCIDLNFNLLASIKPGLIVLCPLAVSAEQVSHVHHFVHLCEAARINTILLDDPVLQLPSKYTDYLIPLYFKAVNANYDEIRQRNRKICSRIKTGKEFVLRNDSGTELYFQRDPEQPVLTENCSFDHKETLFQLPGGEVFFAPMPYSAEGKVVVKYGSREMTVTVEGGYASFSSGEYKGSLVPLAEFGIGTNEAHPSLQMLGSYEKKWGTCHLGFGYNRNFGGVFNSPYHFDITLSHYTLDIDGRRIQFDD